MLKHRDTTPATASPRSGPRLLISSRDAQALARMQAIGSEVPGLQITTRLVSNGHTDPLYGLEELPDFLLLWVSHLWRDELEALLQRPLHERPPLLVCGALDEREGMRMAMQAGARDFLPDSVVDSELLGALQRMLRESHASPASGGRVVAVMNAKGGSGATMLACNLAHQLSAMGANTLLLDLDLQFGSVAHSLDILPTHSHVEVMQQVEDMDSVALRGFCSHFSPTLHVLGGRADDLCLAQDVHLEHLEMLLQLARSSYDWVVVDLPRQIDHLTGITLEQADHCYILLQQSLSHLKDASRLIQILRNDLGVHGSRLHVVVNRYNKSAPITLQDIGEALRCSDLQRLPNDFAAVSESQNSGVPLELHAPRAPITLALRSLKQELAGTEEVDQSLFKRTVSRLFGG
ncbi:AAA family ATPase [Pseudomonas sp. PDM15]|uniref:AAA family ATPase n=1 Tax=Pseudomonas sp. PDM15 TaxID=2769303 RepID=UPI0017805FBD|nr:AAA family ATPase [Pseudomonas sp. PDM15]MBD9425742.1 AAA family ATPase [Pseudomonas sp. PDM15]